MKIKPSRRLELISEYWFSKKLEEVRKLNAQGKNIINLGIGSPDLAPSPATMKAASDGIFSEKNHGYPSYKSTPEFRKALCEWYKATFDVTLDPEFEILPILGSKIGILYVALAFVDPGDSILVPDPGYPAYAAVSHIIGAKVETYDLTEANGFHPDFKQLKKMNLKNCKLMWVNYPHMPTGTPGSDKMFKDLVSFAEDHGILLAHDNPYGLVLNEDSPTSILKFDSKKKTCLELNSFSKAFNMAGWRIGMVAGGRENVDAVLQIKSNVDSGIFLPLQMGATAALSNSEEWHRERNEIYHERRELVFKIFDELGFSYTRKQVGLFVWAKAPEGISDVPGFVDRLLYEAQVFLTPGFIFGHNGKDFVRSSLCAPVQTLNMALDRIKAWKAARRDL